MPRTVGSFERRCEGRTSVNVGLTGKGKIRSLLLASISALLCGMASLLGDVTSFPEFLGLG